MPTFAEFIADAALRGELINTMFEERFFDLAGVLHRVTEALTADSIPHELIGGLAVLVHVESVDPEYSSLTRDVDLMVRRADLDRVKSAAARYGFLFRHAAGVDMLIPDEGVSKRSAVHLIFSEEKLRDSYSSATPALHPETRHLLGRDVAIIPVADLVRMKLTSFRLKDQVHIQTLDRVGLITAEVESGLLPELLSRLHQVRSSE
jgi:hypothetical protein